MLRMQGPQAECLWDEVLPAEVRELPEDLASIDELLSDPALLEPIAEHWRSEAAERGRDASAHGRPTIAMVTYVRLMVVKHRSGWGYETLIKEVSDSLHLRSFCGLSISARVPDESTVRKLTLRLGSEVVAEITRMVIAKAARERRFSPRAARIDSTVIEADVRYPSDAMLALQGARALARQGSRLGERLGQQAKAVRDRSRAIGRRVRQISRTIGRRSGEAREQVIELNRQAGELLRSSAREARRLAEQARSKARGRGALAKLRAAEVIEQLAERCERVAEQTLRRAKGLKITGRIVSLSDPEARPIRKGKAGKPTEFGYVAQICELTPSTKPGARGLIVPAATAPGNPRREHALARDRGRDRGPGPPPQGGRSRWRLRPPQVRRAARRPRARAGLRLGPPRIRLATDQTPPAPLPNRHRGPDLSPQARLWVETVAAQRPRGPADLDRMGDPRL